MVRGSAWLLTAASEVEVASAAARAWEATRIAESDEAVVSGEVRGRRTFAPALSSESDVSAPVSASACDAEVADAGMGATQNGHLGFGFRRPALGGPGRANVSLE